MSNDRLTLGFLVLVCCLSVLAMRCALAQDQAPATTVVVSCDFEGPYSSGEQQIQEGCANNWQYGNKHMLFTADKNSGRPGTTQRIQIRGMASGAMQLFYTKLKLQKDRYYRVSCWMKSDGLEGPLWLYVRKIGYPWANYVPGRIVAIPEQWTLVTLTGKSTGDAPDDVGMCWEGGGWAPSGLTTSRSRNPQSPCRVASPAASRPGLDLFHDVVVHVARRLVQRVLPPGTGQQDHAARILRPAYRGLRPRLIDRSLHAREGVQPHTHAHSRTHAEVGADHRQPRAPCVAASVGEDPGRATTHQWDNATGIVRGVEVGRRPAADRLMDGSDKGFRILEMLRRV